MKEEALYLDKESQIKAIDQTFEASKKPIKEHPGKPGITPVEILPIFPDFKLWKFPFAQVMFDADPAPVTQTQEMSQAMIRGVMDESGEQFVAYFLPTEDTINKRKLDELEGHEYREGEEYEYVMAREYNWNVKNKATKGYEENYFFVWRDDNICYNELETRVRLSKRRVKQGSVPNNSKLVVKHRPLSDQDFKSQDIRMSQLEPPQEEEEQTQEPISKEIITNATEKEIVNKDNESDDNKKDNSKAKSATRKSSASDKSSSSSSSASSSSSESSDSSSSSESDSEEEARRKKTRQDAAAIFGSGSDSD
jgi:RNA polymerase II-associated factor 1